MSVRAVAVSGSLRAPSSTRALLDGILAALAREVDLAPTVIELAPLADGLAAAVTGREQTDAVTSALADVEAADLLVVATPIYRGSYTGLFKQFFDLVHHDALAATPVLLAAGGGDDQHSLAIDHQLRPLFAFFRAATLPVGVYARGADFADGRIDPDGALPGRIARAVEAAAPVLRGLG